MQSFKAVTDHTSHMYSHHHHHPSFFLRGGESEDTGRIKSGRFGEIGDLYQPPIVFPQNDAVDLTPIYSPLKSLNTPNPSSLHFGTLNQNLLVSSSSVPAIAVNTGELLPAKTPATLATVSSGVQNWRDPPTMGDTPQQPHISADVGINDRNQFGGGVQQGATMVKPTEPSKEKIQDSHVTYQDLKRLAQNREAARKSRIRKKAYVQQLETSQQKLTLLEEELEKVRQQSMCVATGFAGDQGHSNGGVSAFDLNYARWMDEHQELINELRSAISTRLPDEDLRLLVEGVMLHYSELFRLKGVGSKSDIFHMLSGMWITPAERFFMWLGGFRSSEMLKILVSHLEPLTDQQLMGFCNLQQSSQQAEDALSQGMEALQQSLVEALSSTCLISEGSGNMVDYMGQMAVAMNKLSTLENFIYQADLLRQQTLQQLHRILTTRQAARALLVIHDYTSRLRALSSLWLARPKN